MKKNKKLSIFIGLVTPFFVHAAEEADPLKFSGFIDASYNYLQNSNLFISDVYDRAFDLNENGFTLQQAAGTVSYLPSEGLGFLLNGLVGRDAITANSYGRGWNIKS